MLVTLQNIHNNNFILFILFYFILYIAHVYILTGFQLFLDFFRSRSNNDQKKHTTRISNKKKINVNS